MCTPDHATNWLVDGWKKQAHQQGYSYSYVQSGKLQPLYLTSAMNQTHEHYHSLDSRLPGEYQRATPEMRDWYNTLRKWNYVPTVIRWSKKQEAKPITFKNEVKK